MEKNKKQASVTKQLLDYAENKKYLMYISWFFAGLSAVTLVIPYVFFYLVVKTAVEGSIAGIFDMELMALYSLYAIGFVILNFAVYFAALMCSHICAFHIRNNMVIRLMGHLQKLSVGYHIHNPSGKIRKIVEQNSASTETYVAHNLPDYMQAMVLPIVTLIFLFVFDWRLGGACLVPVIFAFAIQKIMMGDPKERAKMMKAYQDAQEEINHAAVEYVRGISVVKVFNQTVHSFKNFHGAIIDFKNHLLKWTLDFEFQYRIFLTAINAIFVIFIPVFIILYNRDTSSVNLIMSFIFYIIFMPVLTSSLLKIMYMGSFQAVTADSLARIESIISVEVPAEPQNPISPQNYNIVFENVSFQYAGADRNALENFSCSMENGKVTALVGQSGSGKTTIANLIMSFYRPTFGKITIGGVDTKDIGPQKIMDMVSYVFQENKLLKMSILDNIRVAKPSATQEEVIEAMRKAQCEEIIDRLPDGLNTHFGQKGVYLSGGEIQRVAIARALLKDAPIIILDEATAFTDPENEYKIKRAFDELLKDKTVIMIAHRLSSIKDADNIMVLSEGALVEQGTHESLVQKDNRYGQMWKEFNKSINWTFKQESSLKEGGNLC